MEINPDLLASILSQQVGDTPIWENEKFLQQSISETEQQIQELETQLRDSKSQMTQGKSDWQALKAGPFSLENCKKELNEIHQQMKEPLNFVFDFFYKHQNEINIFTEYNQLENVLSIASVSLLDDKKFQSTDLTPIFNECEKNNYSHLLNIIQERVDEVSAKEKGEIYPKIEKMLQQFSVTNQNSLNQIFLKENGLGSSQFKEYQNLIDRIVKIDRDWEFSLTEVSKRVFNTRFLYHCQNSEINSIISFVSLITGLLRVTIQSAFVVMNYPERLSKNSDIFNHTTHFLLKNAVNELLSKNDGSCIFYRTLFEQSKVLDQWLISLEYYKMDLLCSLLFNEFGDEWINVEKQTISISIQNYLDEQSDFAFTICGTLSKLAESPPSSLKEGQLKTFVKNCIVPSEKNTLDILTNAFNSTDSKNYKQIANILNAIFLISTQLMEIYEIYDGLYQELYQDSKTAKQNCFDLCQKAAQNAYLIFEKEGGNYLLSKTIPYRNGAVTPSLTNALVAISEPVDQMKDALDPTLYGNQYLASLARTIDAKVYKMIAKKIDWSQESSIDQFVIDLDALIQVFGSEEMRMLRSAKMFLTSKEEKYLDYELPEEDVEILMMRSKKNSIRK
ncbi:hypothetical protein TRFO_36614 [Tritrichomonas foetus]|uniref:Component of oligomeric Golgi complex 7 n=1 Tax=Tritrichomonas foetus TaxID=1144522 RepID=A0A1J4JDC4_9EUKA|nr:hypothetical protein TRFO_36614 [Tritrichomonas foetus]|eukprot:OHS97198.1 hypothetical protein TRFO_36614 [Tritrichomonas foetus]